MLHTNLRTEQDLSIIPSSKPSKRTNPNTNKRSFKAGTLRSTLTKTGVPFLFSRVDSQGDCTYQYRRRLHDSSIQRSLLTDDFGTAILRTQELNRITQIVFDAIRKSIAVIARSNDEQLVEKTKAAMNKSKPQNLPFRLIKSALDKAYDKALARYKAKMDKEGPYSEIGMEELQATFDQDAAMNDLLESLPERNSPTVTDVMVEMAGLKDVSEKDISLIVSQRPSMLRDLLAAIKEYNSFIQKYGAKEPFSSVTGPLDSSSGQPHEESSKSIQELIDAFIRDKKLGEAWTEKSAGEIASILTYMQDILFALGVESTSDLSFDKATTFKDALLALPAHKTHRDAYLNHLRGGGELRTRDQVNEVYNCECLSITTVNKYLVRVKALMDHAYRHGFVERNFFGGLTIKQTKRKGDARKEYTPEQVQIIVREIQDRSNLKATKSKPFHYWLPLLGIFTGARMNELCQSYLDDISEVDGILCILITDKRPDQRLKNRASERIIPIHSELIRLGFLDFVQELRAKGESRLFPELPEGRDGYSKNAIRWFGSFRRKVLPTGDGLVFHSFRHTVATEMKRKGVEVGLAAAILGHSVDSITYEHYGKRYAAQQLLDALTDGLRDLC